MTKEREKKEKRRGTEENEERKKRGRERKNSGLFARPVSPSPSLFPLLSFLIIFNLFFN
jgi:hypothetical protein